MNCTNYEILINKLLDGELQPEQSMDVFAHLAQCVECRKIYHRIQSLSASLDKIPERLPEPVNIQYPRLDIPLMKTQSIWNRQVQMRLPLVAMMIMVMVMTIGLAIALTTRFTKNEPIYVMKLPAVTITADSRTINSIK